MCTLPHFKVRGDDGHCALIINAYEGIWRERGFILMQLSCVGDLTAETDGDRKRSHPPEKTAAA
jgi:hypothetical protein